MKRKLLVLLITLFLSNRIFATGVGIQIQAISPFSLYSFSLDKISNYAVDYEFLCLGTMKLDRYNIIFGTGMNIGKENDVIYFGNSGYIDYLFIDTQIKNNWNFNFGTGVSYNLMFAKEFGAKYSLGGRVFAGTNWTLFDNYIELYFLQNIGCRLEFYNLTQKGKTCLYFPTDIGIRWHF